MSSARLSRGLRLQDPPGYGLETGVSMELIEHPYNMLADKEEAIEAVCHCHCLTDFLESLGLVRLLLLQNTCLPPRVLTG